MLWTRTTIHSPAPCVRSEPVTAAPPFGPGLTVARLLESLPHQGSKRFLNPGVLSVPNAIFGGLIDGSDVRRVIQSGES